MTLMEALIARLLAAAGVTALVDSRVYPVTRPQLDALPAITLQIIDEEREQTMAGFQSLQRALVQIDAWSISYAVATAIKEAVIAALVPAAVQDDVEFRRAFVRSRDLSEPTATLFVLRPSMDFTFFYSAQ